MKRKKKIDGRVGAGRQLLVQHRSSSTLRIPKKFTPLASLLTRTSTLLTESQLEALDELRSEAIKDLSSYMSLDAMNASTPFDLDNATYCEKLAYSGGDAMPPSRRTSSRCAALLP